METTSLESSPPEQTNFLRSKVRLERLSERLQEIVPAPEDNLFHIQRFIEDLKIINKRGELVSLIMNRAQEAVFHRLMECREKRVPARFICCKSRQLGISTLIEAFIFALITHYPNRFALIAANSIESAQTIFAMAQRFRRYLEPGRTARPATGSARRIEYLAPHHSRLQIDTAANKSLGRGGTLHYVHASEVAFWERAEDPILAINQSVPQHWDTLVFWESTANGMHNLFHRTWIAAERGESDMEPIFLSWKGFPEYSLPVGQRERLQLSQDEEAYAQKHDLSRDQIKWAIERRPDFLKSLVPLEEDPSDSPIVLAMIRAGQKAGTGPMAAVAGAVAEFVGKGLLPLSPEIIIENGGDIFLKVDRPVTIGLFAGNSRFSGRVGIRIEATPIPLGICTSSGTVGPSLSLGMADAATIISRDVPLADAVATGVGNRVHKPGDLKSAVEWGMKVPGVDGAIAILADKIAALGDIELVPLPESKTRK